MFSLNSSYLTLFFFIFILLTSSMAGAETNAPYVIESFEIKQPLEGLTGNPENGRKLVAEKNKGNCLACHALPIPEEEFHGTIGPALIDIASRLNSAQLRLRIADMKQINPFSIMPGYYREADKMNRLAEKYEGSTILSAQEIEDIVAYLMTLGTNQIGSLR